MTPWGIHALVNDKEKEVKETEELVSKKMRAMNFKEEESVQLSDSGDVGEDRWKDDFFHLW